MFPGGLAQLRQRYLYGGIALLAQLMLKELGCIYLLELVNL